MFLCSQCNEEEKTEDEAEKEEEGEGSVETDLQRRAEEEQRGFLLRRTRRPRLSKNSKKGQGLVILTSHLATRYNSSTLELSVYSYLECCREIFGVDLHV